jgi:hypothetical protein
MATNYKTPYGARSFSHKIQVLPAENSEPAQMKRPAAPSKRGASRLLALLKSLRAPQTAYEPAPRNLTAAARRGDLAAVRVFLDAGANLDERTIGFTSALHAACAEGHLEIAKLLHSRGAKLFADGEPFSCIYFAAGKGHIDIVRWGLDAGLPVKKAAAALAAAAGEGRYEVVKLLLERGVNQADPMARRGVDGHTPAEFARRMGFTALAKFMLTGSLDAARHAKEAKRSETFFADFVRPPRGMIVDPTLRREAVEEALALVSETASRASDREGVPVLVRAVVSRERAIVEALLGAGADPNAAAGQGGATALTEACALGERHIARLLLDAGADPNRTDASGRTPLMFAAAKGDEELVTALIGADANTRAKDSSGQTAAKHACGPHAERLRDLIKSSKRTGTQRRRNHERSRTI